jgi:hypothetical protein
MQANFFKLLERVPIEHRRLFAITVLTISQTFVFGQNVGINSDGSLPNKSAMLDIKSSNKGLLIPRVSLKSKTDQTTIASPQESLLVYNTAASGEGPTSVSPGFYYWDGKQWTSMNSSPNGGLNANGSYWSLLGNSSTDSNSFFIGTADNTPVWFRVNNQRAGKLAPNGNTFWGLASGASVTSGFSNTAVGSNALRYNTVRSNLVAIGDSALFNNGIDATSEWGGTNNTAVGSKAAYTNTTGNGLTAVGFHTLYSNTTGAGSTAMGNFALMSNVSGYHNTAIGNLAMYGNRTGDYNTALGSFALEVNDSGTRNTALGYAAATGTKGSYNTSVGYRSLSENITGSSNVAIGADALFSATNTNNIVAVGDSALFNNGHGATAEWGGTNNTAVGSKAAYSNTTGNGLTAIGFHAIYSNKTGAGSTAVGNNALYSNTSGYHNTAVGNLALYNNTIGDYNTGVGSFALETNFSGTRNTALGYGVLDNNKGSDNVGVGYRALTGVTSGSGNAAVGVNALKTATTGSNNVAIGSDANVVSGGISNATVIGTKALAACSNCVVLGAINGVNGSTFGASVGIGTAAPTQKLHVVGNILATGSITSLSDIRFKTSIVPLTNVMSSIQHIDAIYYHWNKNNFPDNDVTDKRQLGFAAQEVEKYFPELVETDSKGYKSVDYGRLTPVLLEAVKELQQQIDELKEQRQKHK